MRLSVQRAGAGEGGAYGPAEELAVEGATLREDAGAVREELEQHPDAAEFSNRLGAMMHGDVESQYELLAMTCVGDRMESIVEHLSDFLARTTVVSDDELN